MILKMCISKSNPYQEQYKDIVTKLEKDRIEAMLMIKRSRSRDQHINSNKVLRAWTTGQTIDRINNHHASDEPSIVPKCVQTYVLTLAVI